MYKNHHGTYKYRDENGKLKKSPIITPLLQLPNLDMIQDIVVSDSLHLLHLGVMKRLLTTFKDGHAGFDGTTWTKATQIEIDKILHNTKTPLEFHRSIRGLCDLTHWKASECAVFLNYVGLAIFEEFLHGTYYTHFISLFCAVTICSTDYFRSRLHVARQLLWQHVAMHKLLLKTVTSNTHNLVHIVNEVIRFGSLPTISGYPFENELYQIKRMLRSGNRPLQQVANRLNEQMLDGANEFKFDRESKQYPVLRHQIKNTERFNEVMIRDGLTLNSLKFADRWILTVNKELVAMNYAMKNGIYGRELVNKIPAFTLPLMSDRINTFKSKDCELGNEAMFEYSSVLCKLFPSRNSTSTFFVPIHHTYMISH